MKKNYFSFYGLCCLLISFSVQAETFPWVWIGKDDILVTEHARAEAEIRLEMTRRSQKSIDVITFDQRADQEIGLPLMQELEKATKRGVKVRIATAWLAPILKDPLFRASRYLKNVAKNSPNLEYLEVGGSTMRQRGWGYIDGVHEKLFIVDRKWLLVTGRGHAGEYIKWLDTAFLIKGPLVDQSQKIFDELWPILQKELNVLAAASVSVEDLQKNRVENEALAGSPVGLPLNLFEHQELLKMKEWLDTPASGKHEMRARTLHHDFFRQLGTQELTPGEYSYEERAQVLKDPVLEVAIDLLKKSKTFNLSILAMTLDPRFRLALIEAIRNGLDVEILTNSSMAHSSISPVGFSIGWYAGLKSLDMLLMENQKDSLLKAYPNIRVYGLTERKSDPDSAKFLHRKLAIFDDTVIFGSHNLTISSSLTQDEVSYEVQSAEFADQMRKLARHSTKVNADLINPLEVHTAVQSTGYRQWLGSQFEKFYLEEQ